jgi:hypothetical protein
MAKVGLEVQTCIAVTDRVTNAVQMSDLGFVEY